MATKPKTFFTASNGAKYEKMPWKGLNIFRRVGGCCPHCLVSLASHDKLGCELLDVL
jgi:hypothetical protein